MSRLFNWIAEAVCKFVMIVLFCTAIAILCVC